MSINASSIQTGGVNPWSVVNKTAEVAVKSEQKVLLSVRVASAFRYAINSIKGFCKFTGSSRFPNGLKLANIVTIPYSIYQIGKSTRELFRGPKNERADAALNITAHAGNIGDATSTFAEGLGAVGAVAVTALTWATPLLGVGLALQTAGMAMTAKSMHETHRFKQIFKEEAGLSKDVSDYTLEDYRKGITAIEEKRNEQKFFISKHFGVDEDKFAESLVEIDSKAQSLLSSDEADEVLQGKKLLQDTMKTLNQRMISKNRFGALSLVIGVVSYIGVGLLFSPVPAVGFTVLALAGIASIVAYKVDRTVTKRFEQELGMTVVR